MSAKIFNHFWPVTFFLEKRKINFKVLKKKSLLRGRGGIVNNENRGEKNVLLKLIKIEKNGFPKTF